MSSRVQAPLISLHNVELRAELASVLGLLSATVPVVPLPERAILELCRHQDLIQSGDAAAGQAAQVDVIGDIATKKVRLEVHVWVWVLTPRDVGSVTIIHVDHVTTFTVLLDGHVRPPGLVHVKIDVLAIELGSQFE